jgi:2-polyprenyl-3-methyl-5-hydroxy-6-metoxy-1,4-benzoquinol methylase
MRLRTSDETIRARLQTYYTRLYRDTLQIPGWHDHVVARLEADDHEGRRLAALEEALGHPVRGRRVLNVGCGPGGFNVVAERAGASTWGIDPDHEAVAIALSSVPGRRLAVAAAEALPFREGSFDVVYCFSVLEHVQDHRRSIREMVRVLRPGGALYLHTPNRWSCFEGHYKVFWLPVFWNPGVSRWLARGYLTLRHRPTAYLETVRPLTFGECRRLIEEAGARITRVLDDGADPVGRVLWPFVRLYYGLFRIRPHVRLVAVRGRDG